MNEIYAVDLVSISNFSGLIMCVYNCGMRCAEDSCNPGKNICQQYLCLSNDSLDE